MQATTPVRPEFIISDESDLRDHFPPTHDLAARKCLDHLDPHARAFLARAPFLCIGTQSADGAADVSPRGDPNGFVTVLDDRTLLIPDRPGNNRLDTLANILAQPAVGLLFLVPGYDETLRINGTAQISRDPELCALTAMNDRPALAVIVVRVQEVYLHCAKALRRSRLWDATAHVDRAEMPSLIRMLHDQVGETPQDPKVMQQLDEALEAGYKRSMY
ncbi:Phosphohydrolase (MutT/nudix family protein) [Candidatus Rhodobacter oscarellae]|uniref:Phosphohydrolase (MutT/nudix family protein) n=1 Tax=Candidatus Rhodobacter oscarellae TaxID=1675527 RepID=A0A0J9GTI6_9RHOB|nr:pyridoxamine 5'-phosphate oxidase family protein [Candidatus Rhodobacter lobularis]KMW56813.1 Phosphohydrolase (MutT/nudix family protein) [Candidatus Rhodobacter lobularis]